MRILDQKAQCEDHANHYVTLLGGYLKIEIVDPAVKRHGQPASHGTAQEIFLDHDA